MARLKGMGDTPKIDGLEQPKPVTDAEMADIVERTHAAVKKLDVGKGARWDDVLEAVSGKKLTLSGDEAKPIEDALNLLMDRGLIYEPTLGILKGV